MSQSKPSKPKGRLHAFLAKLKVSVLPFERLQHFAYTDTPMFIPWILLICALAFIGVLWNAQHSISQIKQVALDAYQQKANQQVESLIDEKRRILMSLAHALSNTSQIQQKLCDECDPDTTKLDRLVVTLSNTINIPDLWVQVLDTSGKSRYRSWSDVTGDSLLDVRKDLREFYVERTPLQSISVGKFTLSLKATVPVYNPQDKFVGAVELIAPLDQLQKFLPGSEQLESIMLIDKRLTSNLTLAKSNQFIDGFYLITDVEERSNLEFLHTNLETILTDKVFTFDGEHFWISINITNDFGRVLGYWLLRVDHRLVYTQQIENLFKQTLYSAGALLALLVLFLMAYIFKYRADRQHAYYRKIFNSASDMLMVIHNDQLLEANSHFFEFFDDTHNIDEFNAKYGNISDQFVKEKDWLQSEFHGQNWLDYVVTHPLEHHKAKMIRDGQERFFTVKVMRLNDVQPLYTVALQDISIQVEYQNKLLRIANTDALTGIGNRLFFDRELYREVKRSHRYTSGLCLVVFDIDHFKLVNDTYGHDAGDTVLRWLTKKVTQEIRDSDIFCRYGGEEFAIILPQTHLEDAASKVNGIRQTIAESETPVEGLKITLSFGVAELSIWDKDVTLFKRADNALYKAKQDGRNQVVKCYHQMPKDTEKLIEAFRRHG